MRSSAGFFRLFPPPTFMLMPHAGLDVSDDAIRCLSYTGFGAGRKLGIHGKVALPPGLVSGGDIKDEKEFISRMAEFGKEYDLSYVKVSIPEEKAYLFQTDVPAVERKEMGQNIEFKLEENVPLSAADAVFYFDVLPPSTPNGSWRASVSVVPRTYVEHYMSLLEKAGLSPVAFEVTPKAISRAVVRPESNTAKLIVHVMNEKIGIYVVSAGVVNFASTSPGGSGGKDESRRAEVAAGLTKELGRICSYWSSHGTGKRIDEALLVGESASVFEEACRKTESETPFSVRVADIWSNAFDINRYLPPISHADSLEFAVAAGLALDTHSDI